LASFRDPPRDDTSVTNLVIDERRLEPLRFIAHELEYFAVLDVGLLYLAYREVDQAGEPLGRLIPRQATEKN